MIFRKDFLVQACLYHAMLQGDGGLAPPTIRYAVFDKNQDGIQFLKQNLLLICTIQVSHTRSCCAHIALKSRILKKNDFIATFFKNAASIVKGQSLAVY